VVDRPQRSVAAGGRGFAERLEQSGDRRVEAVEEALLLGRRDDRRGDAAGEAGGGAPPRCVAAAALRSLKGHARPREGVVGVAEPRAVLTRIDANRPVLVRTHAADVDLERLPRPQPVGDLFRKLFRIAGGLERFLRDHAGGLMVAVAVALVALEARDQ